MGQSVPVFWFLFWFAIAIPWPLQTIPAVLPRPPPTSPKLERDVRVHATWRRRGRLPREPKPTICKSHGCPGYGAALGVLVHYIPRTRYQVDMTMADGPPRRWAGLASHDATTKVFRVSNS